MPDVLAIKGATLDKIQARIQAIKQSGEAVPLEFQQKAKMLAEAQSSKTINDVRKWEESLPAIEIAPEKITWQIFKLHMVEARDRLNMYAIEAFIENEAMPISAKGFLREYKKLRQNIKQPDKALEALFAIDKRVTSHFTE